MHRTTITVTGTIEGPLWWPIGQPAQVTVHETYTVDGESTLREIIGAIVDGASGDFSGDPKLTADSTISVIRWRSTGHHGRTWEVTALPSIADYVDAEAWTYGPAEDAEWSAAVGVR